MDDRPELNLEAVVIGMGPSFFEWIKGDAADRAFLPATYPPPATCLLYGSGRAPAFIKLDVYGYACPEKHDQLPTDGTPIYSRHEVYEPGMILWDDSIPRGGSAGGMMLSLACSRHKQIGLIGFDGFGMPPFFISDFIGQLRYWKSHQRTIVSLMPESLFDSVTFHRSAFKSL